MRYVWKNNNFLGGMHIFCQNFSKNERFLSIITKKSGVRELKSEKRFASIHLSPVDARNPIFGQVGVLRGSKKSDAGIFEILRFSPILARKRSKMGDHLE